MQSKQLQSKPHYPILDGLRGTAAILVVLLHLFAYHPIPHGYLAVDFFYLLSGFVVGYAYDDRWQRMSIKDFFKIRLIRLHPLIILATVIGVICFCFDPYTQSITQVGILKFTVTIFLSSMLLPSPDVRGLDETHSLNGPSWSLLQEYIANIIYAVLGRRLSKTGLSVIVIISGVTLTGIALWHGNISQGWGYNTFWIAVVRMMYSFFAGLLLFRTGTFIQIPKAYILCPLALIILFFLPTFKYNGLYEAACVIIAFPVIVAAGADGKIRERWLKKICKFSGDISYPIYILHYPFIYIYLDWIEVKKPAYSQIIPVACGLFVFFIVLAYVALKLYDEPVSAWLKKKLLLQQ